jgi:hypothetical protein
MGTPRNKSKMDRMTSLLYLESQEERLSRYTMTT